MRLALTLALLASLAACDRKAQEASQANAATSAEQAAPEVELAGKLDMTHRGESAPAAGFVEAAGKPVTINQFRGTPVLVNLWATWCGPCVRELPSLDRLAGQAGSKLKILAVSQDDPKSSDPKGYWAEKKFSALRTIPGSEVRARGRLCHGRVAHFGPV